MLAKELLTMVSACINITQKDRQNQFLFHVVFLSLVFYKMLHLKARFFKSYSA